MSRYTDIIRATRLQKDYENYKNWLELSTEARQTLYAAQVTEANKVKTSRVPGYIVPFDNSGASFVYVPARLIAAQQSGRGSALALTVKGLLDPYTSSTAEVAALTTPNVLENAKQFKFAKFTVIQRVATATTKTTSRITKRQYYKHENDSVTGSFGRNLQADTYDSVVTAIKEKPEFIALFQGSELALASKFRFVPEGV